MAKNCKCFDESSVYCPKTKNVKTKTIGLLRKLQKTLQKLALMTMYKAFVKPHLNYGDVIYDEAYKEIFHKKPESIQ